ncbi:MAG: hypothetical protein ACLFVO_13805 [Chloroflexaceae bacterium]
MNSPAIPELLGTLSYDIILVCDSQEIVQEANPLAQQLLGEQIIGHPLLELMTTMSRAKGRAFLNYLHDQPDLTQVETWELLFHVPQTVPMRVRARGGPLEQGGWLIVCGCEPPYMMALYHEVLAMNSELTNLVRELSKKQSVLTNQLTQLLQAEEQNNAGQSTPRQATTNGHGAPERLP